MSSSRLVSIVPPETGRPPFPNAKMTIHTVQHVPIRIMTQSNRGPCHKSKSQAPPHEHFVSAIILSLSSTPFMDMKSLALSNYMVISSWLVAVIATSTTVNVTETENTCHSIIPGSNKCDIDLVFQKKDEGGGEEGYANIHIAHSNSIAHWYQDIDWGDFRNLVNFRCICDNSFAYKELEGWFHCRCDICEDGFGDNPIFVEAVTPQRHINSAGTFVIDDCEWVDCNFECNGPCRENCRVSGPKCKFCSQQHDQVLLDEICQTYKNGENHTECRCYRTDKLGEIVAECHDEQPATTTTSCEPGTWCSDTHVYHHHVIHPFNASPSLLGSGFSREKTETCTTWRNSMDHVFKVCVMVGHQFHEPYHYVSTDVHA